ncbi:uncharacterized protein LOC131952467 [Physella acuta]|uniref:uncharacterized protein LOC131952467 n=1 Tax=Physella acuta TaxID=109671 RepID=UPI0027DAFF7C|nr:uncharacterized protein LOC131952467 [Physella acuta]
MNKYMWPTIQNMDIVNYFVFSTNLITQEQMKNYKSLKSYVYFTDGLVTKIKCRALGSKVVVVAQVKHSQKAAEKPVEPWVCCEPSGVILSAHCNCMAGLGESCSHVGALLFAIEVGCRLMDNESTTQRSCQWILPPYLQKVPYLKVADTDFDTPETKKIKLDKQPITHTPGIVVGKIIQSAPLQKDTFLEHLSVLKHSHTFKFPPTSLPAPLTTLFDTKYTHLGYTQLVESTRQAIEAATRDQSNSKDLFRQRAGHFTASRMQVCCNTNLAQPSLCLIKQVCYPKQQTYRSAGMKWGCQHERCALQQYAQIAGPKHRNFKITKSGLVVHPEVHYIGASPDGLVTCDCCGHGVVEIKFPSCTKDKMMDDVSKKEAKNIGLGSNKQLSSTHRYYYQIQTQMAATKSSYGDFIIWTTKDVHIERIFFDSNFWSSISVKAAEFFQKIILPELLACHFTNKKATGTTMGVGLPLAKTKKPDLNNYK